LTEFIAIVTTNSILHRKKDIYKCKRADSEFELQEIILKIHPEVCEVVSKDYSGKHGQALCVTLFRKSRSKFHHRCCGEVCSVVVVLLTNLRGVEAPLVQLFADFKIKAGNYEAQQQYI
jgi:hypothetical protein